jgi:hypothetical protein
MHFATTDPLGCSRRSLACPTGTFLLPGFFATTGDLTAGFSAMSSQAGICHLADECLVHQVNVNWGFKNLRWKFHCADFLAFHVYDINFHNLILHKCENQCRNPATASGFP